MKKRCSKKKKGFTLVELLVVIAIIGILAAIGVTALSGARSKARDAKRVADLKQIQSALELYYTDNASYPIGMADGSGMALGALTDCNNTACLCIDEDGIVAACDAGGTTYMGLIPKDPSGPTTECAANSTAPCNYSYFAYDSSGGACTSGEVCTSYAIYSYLETGSGGLTSGVVCANQNGMKNSTCP